MSCKYNNCKICGYKSECEIYKENAELKQAEKGKVVEHFEAYGQCRDSRRIAELEKENAEAKERIKTLEYRCENIKDTDTMELVALQKENAELKKLFADCDTCKRTCDIGNCCKFGSAYLPDVEKILNKQRQLTKAIKHLKDLVYVVELGKNELATARIAAEAKEFLRETK